MSITMWEKGKKKNPPSVWSAMERWLVWSSTLLHHLVLWFLHYHAKPFSFDLGDCVIGYTTWSIPLTTESGVLISQFQVFNCIWRPMSSKLAHKLISTYLMSTTEWTVVVYKDKEKLLLSYVMFSLLPISWRLCFPIQKMVTLKPHN